MVGVVLTVADFTVAQPPDKLKVMLTVPLDTPETIPEEEPTDAIAGLVLLHVPVPGAVRVMVVPTHRPEGPLMGAAGLTVIILVTRQVPIE